MKPMLDFPNGNIFPDCNYSQDELTEIADALLTSLTANSKPRLILKVFIGVDKVHLIVDHKTGYPGIIFNFKGSIYANCCRMLYNSPADTLILELYKLSEDSFTVLAEYSDIHVDDSKKLFEDSTGVFLSLN